MYVSLSFFQFYWRLIRVDFYSLCNFIVMHVSFNLISWLIRFFFWPSFSLHFIDMHVSVSFLHIWSLIFFLTQFYIVILQSLQRSCVYFKNIYNESYKEKIKTTGLVLAGVTPAELWDYYSSDIIVWFWFIPSLNYLHFILFYTSKAIWFI
jgi:hypothetical protein